MIEFKPWGKTPRLFRDMVVTEKLDGTNACVVIRAVAVGLAQAHGLPEPIIDVVNKHDEGNFEYWVAAQSRNRLITPEADNAGFAKWVYDNAHALVSVLGEGYHYGEWWGQGIQRGYGLSEKRFSLFNVSRWSEIDGTQVPGLYVVPTLLQNTFNTAAAGECLLNLSAFGSKAAPGFMTPEGVVVYHAASGQSFKALIEADSEPKSKREQVLAA